jgi:hypothetical protein
MRTLRWMFVFALLWTLTQSPAAAQYVDFDSTGVSHRDLGRILSQDWRTLTAMGRNNGVVAGSGCDCTQQGSPNMTVHVSGCTISYNGANVSVSAADPTITTAPGSPNVRLDLLSVNGSGTIAVTAGTAGTPSTPGVTGTVALPAIPVTGSTNHIPLCVVYVGTGVTTILTADLISKKIPVLGQAPTFGGAVTATGFASSSACVTFSTLPSPAVLGQILCCSDCVAGATTAVAGTCAGSGNGTIALGVHVSAGTPGWRCF